MKKKVIDIYKDGILDGHIKEWDINTYIMLNSYSMEYDDDMFPSQIKHSYGVNNENVSIYALARKQDEEDCIKCFYVYKETILADDFDRKVQSFITK